MEAKVGELDEGGEHLKVDHPHEEEGVLLVALHQESSKEAAGGCKDGSVRRHLLTVIADQGHIAEVRIRKEVFG